MPLTKKEFITQFSQLTFDLTAGAKTHHNFFKALHGVYELRSFPYNLKEVSSRPDSFFKVPRRKVSSNVAEVFSDLNPKNRLPIVVLDLDETLCHAYVDPNFDDYRLSPRPMVEAFIQLLHTLGIELVVWTAGLKQHALSALELIDPTGCIQHVIHRPVGQKSEVYWTKEYSDEYLHRKALALVPAQYHSRIIMLDDNTHSVAHPSSISRSIIVSKYACKQIVNRAYYGEPTLDYELLPKLFLLLKLAIEAKQFPADRFCTADGLEKLCDMDLLIEARVSIRDVSLFYIVNLDSFPEIDKDNIQDIVAELLPKERLPIYSLSYGHSCVEEACAQQHREHDTRGQTGRHMRMLTC